MVTSGMRGAAVARDRAGGDPRPARALGERQDDGVATAGALRDAGRGPHRGGRRGRHDRAAGAAAVRDGVPALRAVPAPRRGRERGVRVEGAGRPEGGRGPGAGGSGRVRAPHGAGALRRSATAGGAGVRDRRYTGATAVFQVETERGDRLEVLARPDAARVGERVYLEAAGVMTFPEER